MLQEVPRLLLYSLQLAHVRYYKRSLRNFLNPNITLSTVQTVKYDEIGNFN